MYFDDDRSLTLTVNAVATLVIFEFYLNVFTEFSKFSYKNNIILKRLLGLNPISPVSETETLPLSHRDTANREDS